VKFLLDVNALVAWQHPSAQGHASFHAWAKAQGFPQLATCAQSELGFIRVSMQAYRFSLEQAQTSLAEMKRAAGSFVTSAPSPKLAAWSTTAAKTSDAYLAQVATSNGMKLATFDAGVPGATLIEEPLPDD
jgi:predicted nucleic acid-binding protein